MNPRELTLWEHLRELRRRLLISVIALVAGTALAFPFWEKILILLARPAQELNDGAGVQLIATQVTEALTTSFKISMVAGFVVASPVILYQAIRFVAPGLTAKERNYLLALLPGCLLAFVGGVAFGYFVLTPQALPFLINFGSSVIDDQTRVSSYVDFMIRLLFGMGLAFQTPVVMYLLAQLGIVNARTFSRFRRYWIIVAFILGAIITPTVDPYNQTLVAGTLWALYEGGILLAKLAGRKQSRSSRAIEPLSGAE
jgi:sec-independent protein translocase protein TatC